MKILFLSPRFYPDIGGVETHALKTAQALVQRGHEIKIITEGREKNNENIFEMEVTRCNFGQTGRMKKFRIWRKFFNLQKYIRWADIIHCHDVFFWYLPFRFLYPLKPVITTFHGYETVFPPLKKAINIRQISKKLSSKTVNVGSYIEKWYGTPADEVIYGGYDGIDNDMYKETSNVKNQKLKILLIGRLEEDIGVRLYLDALKVLQKKNIEFQFEACGDGNLRNEVSKFGIVHKFVPNTYSYIQKADIIFASSYLSILDSLACRKKTIAVYTNPLKEDYLKNSPFAQWITISDSAIHIAAHIRNLHHLPSSNEDQLKRFLKNMTWDHIAELYEKLYRST